MTKSRSCSTFHSPISKWISLHGNLFKSLQILLWEIDTQRKRISSYLDTLESHHKTAPDYDTLLSVCEDLAAQLSVSASRDSCWNSTEFTALMSDIRHNHSVQVVILWYTQPDGRINMVSFQFLVTCYLTLC